MLAKSAMGINFKKIYETDMAEGLKSMMLAGHGYAFLPESSVKKEVEEGLVMKAFSSKKYALDEELEIRVFRRLCWPSKEEDGHNSRHDGSLNAKQVLIENLWNNL